MKKIAKVATLFALLLAGSLGAQNSPAPPAKPRAVALSGNFSIGASFYEGGAAARRRPFGYALNGAPVLTLWGIQLPFTFTMSEQGRSYSQPFQQFGVSPKWKWMQFHAGFRAVSFSAFTLGGQQMLGAGMEANPGKWRAGLVCGRFRATEQPGAPLPQHPLDAYHNQGFAAKFGYGAPDRYLDLILLRAHDIAPAPAEVLAPADQNTVLGLSGQYRFSKKLSLKTELSASHYTGRSLASADSGAASLRWAGETSLNAQFKKFGFKLGFKQVDPGYRSMGCAYLQHDYRQYSLGGNFRAFKNKLMLNGTLGVQTNNLAHTQGATTRRIITTANITLTPGTKTTLSLCYNNFGLTQAARQTGGIRLRPDSVLVAQLNNNFSGNLHYRFGRNRERQHQLGLAFNFNQMGNFSAAITTPTNTTNYSGSLSYGFPLPAGLEPSLSLQWMRNATANGALTNTGLSLSLSKDAAKGKWNNALNAAFFRNSDGSGTAGYTLQTDLTTSYKIRKRLSVSLQCSYLDNHSASALAGGTFSELLARIALTGSF